jgi:hypothetical protein
MGQDGRPVDWWHAIDRRTFGKGALAFTALATMSGCKGEEEVSAESLVLQRQHGWNVGAEANRLFFRNISEQDATGSSSNWKQYTDPNRLMSAWRPQTETWKPFFVPTLIQSLQASTLRQQVRPIFSRQMADAFGRGETLRKDLLSQVTKGEETLFIADLPGPEAVAFGAGMAGWADVMVDFENWPHPLGVVRSHETLGTMLYYADYLQKRKQELPKTAPGLLLLDNQRLAPYTDANLQFDNRYLATVPRAPALKQRGVSHVMYIVSNRQQRQENDDLNDEFVEYKDAGLQVVIFPLSDLQKVTQPVAKTDPNSGTRTVHETRYYYGGGFGSHLGFLMLYSFLAPRPTAYYYYPYSTGPTGVGGRRITLGQTTPPTTRAPSYTPRPRPTQYSGTRVGGRTGVGRRKPSGFGRTTVRRSGGRVTGIGSRSARARARGGRSSSFGRGGFFGGRSGSFGRGGFFGG